MSPVAQLDLDADIFDLDLEFVLEAELPAAIQACSGSDYTCTTNVSYSGTCAATQNCGGCTPTYGRQAPGMCY
ncbi:hypothetical protein Sru01_49800 [Sphaerisporangium rufum]|uniref:Uncharacterized protein n=1 Tax=Sphaerisporangium rufum TaxID=1381558 RepID=A0A919R673_9ACTN|nr:hypothetical protein [Sphaerisporangium rufum]GII79998.1 hypothetical protein Sru01_49800 [Sphaerisporangium rufum]